jgi:type I restriction enzyme S subunit
MIELCQYITDETHQAPRYSETGRMCLSAKNVKPFKFMSENHKLVSEEDFVGYRKNWTPEINDILLTRVGAGIGETTLIDQDLEFAIYVSVGLLKMFPSFLEPNYLVCWLNSPERRQYSSENTYRKGVSQGNLNLSLIRDFQSLYLHFKNKKLLSKR